jgi:glycosyltransferase involved in cell wall biosynthesis
MFKKALAHEKSAIVFPAANVKAMAAAIRRLASDSELYSNLSRNSNAAWKAIQLPVTWGTLIDKWLSSSASDLRWIQEHRLMSGLYDRQIRA